MSYTDLGLVRQSFSDRFNDLYSSCKEILYKTSSLNVGKAKEVLDKINQDLTKLKNHGDKELTERYKTSLVPHLENMYRDFRYWIQ